MRFWAIAALLTALTQTGCDSDGAKTTPPPESAEPALPTQAHPRMQTIKVWLGAEELKAELALSPEQRVSGMMFRTAMAENEAMLFVFPVPHQTAFWMKNTSVPLSAAYIDPSGIILEIHDLQPHNTNSVAAASDRIQYVLETPQGWFSRHNIGTGTVVRTEHGPLSEVFTFSPRPGNR